MSNELYSNDILFAVSDIDECTDGTHVCDVNADVTIPMDFTTARAKTDSMETAQTALVSILMKC